MNVSPDRSRLEHLFETDDWKIAVRGLNRRRNGVAARLATATDAPLEEIRGMQAEFAALSFLISDPALYCCPEEP